mmetsp:Transcript_29651/g.40944  ORF Transcript_29651/g.40944 Transcript_29651/m.40944 type:complete len:419 (+) Transcript_29651:582-1838(+)|eukprot:CAMPEP_0196579142 /NCGR_PEP_ID=MMETSP1081-20130531/17672_1 /TAXON_ID=36882 /ORGANISM="Pyramimonas amylifera, Strain CCMP720" /LENGTH=418 /DNA_ID=CAMNT_0041898613 /DNA_START=579 /DNA_END=1835 /DNA_ORIENTATION=+
MIKHVSTILSMEQLKDEQEDTTVPVQSLPKVALLNATHLEDATIPLFRSPNGGSQVDMTKVRSFGSLYDLVEPDVVDIGSSSPDSSESDECGKSLFDTVLLAEWEDRFEKGLFRYDVTACATKVLDGRWGFVAQLNEGRAAKKRPTEFSVDEVLQPFDESKFNFKKVSQSEVLFQFGSSADASSAFVPEVPVEHNPTMVLINVSPIEYGHVLLVPRILDNLPQQMSQSELRLALQMAASANNPYMRVGYNSLGAYATINHLHFQAYYLMAPFPVERAPSSSLGVVKWGVRVQRLREYPCRGLVFEGGDSIAHLADLVGRACTRLQEINVPFNLLIVDCGARVFLFPQCFAERKAQGLIDEDIIETDVNPAAFEICGHIVLKRAVDFEDATEAFTFRLLSAASLDADRFEEICKLCIQD